MFRVTVWMSKDAEVPGSLASAQPVGRESTIKGRKFTTDDPGLITSLLKNPVITSMTVEIRR